MGIDGLADLYVEQLTGGKYLDIKINVKKLPVTIFLLKK
jgi:hypothetical protein